MSFFRPGTQSGQLLTCNPQGWNVNAVVPPLTKAVGVSYRTLTPPMAGAMWNVVVVAMKHTDNVVVWCIQLSSMSYAATGGASASITATSYLPGFTSDIWPVEPVYGTILLSNGQSIAITLATNGNATVFRPGGSSTTPVIGITTLYYRTA